MVIEARQRQMDIKAEAVTPRPRQGRWRSWQCQGRGSHPEAKARRMEIVAMPRQRQSPEAEARQMEIEAMPRQRQSPRG